MHYQLTRLFLRPDSEFVAAIKNINANVTSLDLRHNALYKRNTHDLVQSFKELPPNLTKLNLTGNDLVHKPEAELSEIFRNLPKLKTLQLTGNGFSFKDNYDFALMFQSLPKSLIKLDMGNNGLGFTPTSQLSKGFQKLPSNLQFLGLRDNCLNNIKDAELKELFITLPANVTTVDISNNGFIEKTVEELVNIFPNSVQCVIFNDVTMNLEEFRAEQEFQAEQELLAQQELIAEQERLAQQELQAEQDRLTELERLAQQELQAQTEQALLEQRKAQALKILASIEPQLLIVENKVKELKGRDKCKTAFDAADTLHTTLIELKNQFATGTMDYADFKNNSISAIDTARDELNKQRGWKQLLGNLTLCVLGFGVGYLAVCAYNGSFFKFNTDSANKLDKLQNTIEAAAPAA